MIPFLEDPNILEAVDRVAGVAVPPVLVEIVGIRVGKAEGSRLMSFLRESTSLGDVDAVVGVVGPPAVVVLAEAVDVLEHEFVRWWRLKFFQSVLDSAMKEV